jgi:prepilin-type N-terminal cleavage/methylation domain-containing protein/prepilin-type processing-associated H-X9-DG protein
MRHRRAFTLVELLVVIAIIVVMVGLLLSALQRARTVSTVARCKNNLRQIGLALRQFHDQRGTFPSNGGWDNVQTIMSTNNAPFTPETYDYTTGGHYKWGTGDPSLSTQDQTGSWAYSILPYLEQDGMYQKRTWTRAEPLYACPARRDAVAVTSVFQDAYADYITGGWAWGKTDYAANLFVFENHPTCRSDIYLMRGLSHTILVGEKAFDPSVQGDNWYFDEPYFCGGSKGTHRSGTSIYRDGPGIDFKESWGANHLGGVNFLFGDASVQRYDYNTDPDTIAALLSLN